MGGAIPPLSLYTFMSCTRTALPSPSPKHPERLWRTLNLIPGFINRYSAPRLQLTTHIHPVPRLRIGGAIPPPSLYTFMSCTGTTLPSPSPKHPERHTQPNSWIYKKVQCPTTAANHSHPSSATVLNASTHSPIQCTLFYITTQLLQWGVQISGDASPLSYLKTCDTECPVTLHHIPQEQRTQLHCCKNLKTTNFYITK